MSDTNFTEGIFKALGCTEDITKEFIKVALEDIKTFDEKQRDYGSGNIADFGEYGVLVRTNDKMNRLRNLYKNKKIPTNESVEDSWKDMSIYSIIARLCRSNKWPNS